jgi:hypothetical protein
VDAEDTQALDDAANATDMAQEAQILTRNAQGAEGQEFAPAVMDQGGL